MNVNNENKLQELSLYVNINLNNMNIQKQQNAKIQYVFLLIVFWYYL